MSSYDPSITRSLYAIILNKEDKAPNLPKTDEEEIKPNKEKIDSKDTKKEDKKDAKGKGNNKKDKKDPKVIITEQGLFDRAVVLQLPARNYVALMKGPKNKVFIAESIENTFGYTVHSYDVAKEKAMDYAKGVFSMVASEDRNSVLLNQSSGWSLVNSKTPVKAGKGRLKTNMKIKVDPKQEAHQIFKEGWRYMRDFLYVDNVHGAPWVESAGIQISLHH